MTDLGQKLLNTIEEHKAALRALDSSAVGVKPHPDKWSRKEILGHLIDSACNNHRRFMIVQFKDDMIFSGYAQDQWVEYQDYQNAEWSQLVDLWEHYNLHLVRVINNIPNGILYRENEEHNLHLVAFRPVPKEDKATMAYFIDDYIEHIHHHLRQILS